jgi:hypothetical protein
MRRGHEVPKGSSLPEVNQHMLLAKISKANITNKEPNKGRKLDADKFY